jgi:DNA-binding response OmpR family regulator
MAEKILIIDDDMDTLKLVGLMLQKQSYQIVAANNGLQGLEQAENENPDLILLDVMMPGMDGYEVARRLQNNPQTSKIPILMFTAKTQLDDKVSGFESGADDYLTKPTHPSELTAHVKALLSRNLKKRRIATSPLPEEKRGLVVGIISPRGGQGVSTVAVNLGDALRRTSNSEVIVAELRPGMGTLGPDMGTVNPKALVELLTGNIADMTRQKVKQELSLHATGLRLLFGSVHPKDAVLSDNIPPIETLVNRLSYLSSYLILDLGCGLGSMAQKLAAACNLIYVVVEPSANALTHSKLLMEDLIESGMSEENLHYIVVNRIRSDTQITMTQIETELENNPAVAITPAPELLYIAVRMKTTAIAARDDSLTLQQFTKLAEHVREFEKKK